MLVLVVRPIKISTGFCKIDTCKSVIGDACKSIIDEVS